MSETNDLELDIKENGLDSLAHAVDHYLSESPPSYLKYVVLHVVHAVELLLKARLEQINPDLILRHPDRKPITEDSLTLGFDEIVPLLQSHGVSLDAQDVVDLKALRRFRHRIEHRRLTANREEVEYFVGQAMRFLDGFAPAQLGLNLRDQFDAETYDTLIELLHGFEEASRRAEQEMKQYLVPDRDELVFPEAIECPQCGNYTVVYPDLRCDRGSAECFSPGCRSTVFVGECERCGTGMASRKQFEPDDLFACEYCLHYWLAVD